MQTRTKSFCRQWADQFAVLMWKNYILSKRNYRALVLQLLTPFLFMLVLYVMQEILRNSAQEHMYDDVTTPPADPVGKIPRCISGLQSYCYTIAYTPNNSSVVNDLVEQVRVENEIPASEVIGFASLTAMNAFVLNNLNTTQGGYIFDVGTSEDNFTTIGFALYTNETNQQRTGKIIHYTTYVQIPMMISLQRQLCTSFLPEASSDSNLLMKIVIGTTGATLLFACLMFNFVNLLINLTEERQLRLRASLNLMGLMDSVYWSSWFVAYVVHMTWSVLLLAAFGAAFQFELFLNNSFGTYFLVLWLFSLTLIPMAFFISTILKSTNAAMSIGFLIFMVGFFFQLGASFLFADSVGQATQIMQYVIVWFSPVLLAKGFSDVGDARPGLSFSDILDNRDTWPLIQVYAWMILDFIVYLLIALYCDNVLPNEHGVRRPYYYFLTKSYWTGRTDPPTHEIADQLEEEDDDVRSEAEAVRQSMLPKTTAVKIMGLKKTFAGPRIKKGKNKCSRCAFSLCPCCRKRTPFEAVSNVWYHIDSEQLFCLLGHNGAGKTTTINMLIGQIRPTSGDAHIYGYSILNQLDKIREFMGVCPQFDVLWGDMTAREHLLLFSVLKGIPWRQISKEADERLEEVQLTGAMNRVAASYSGGMKRRLSVALALVGNPKIVFLDEPTTGMDPVSRKEVWTIIERAKKGRVVILTTHSMEEADTLADTIAIMAKGKLQCIGSSIHLKKKFGAGYQITVGVKRASRQQVIEFFEEHLPGVEYESDGVSNFINFGIPTDDRCDLPKFLQMMDKERESLGIMDMLVSLTTLEDVFLKITDKAEQMSDEDELSASDSDADSSLDEPQTESSN